MDAFFATIEQRDGPRGAAARHGGGPNVAAVSTASRGAVFGICSAMPLRTAALCPTPSSCSRLQVREASRAADILRRFTPASPPSIDEAFLDPTGSEGLSGSGKRSSKIKRAIHDETDRRRRSVSPQIARGRCVGSGKPDGSWLCLRRGREFLRRQRAEEPGRDTVGACRLRHQDHPRPPPSMMSWNSGLQPAAQLSARARGVGTLEAGAVVAKSIAMMATDTTCDDWTVL
jgi:hypothetical protein